MEDLRIAITCTLFGMYWTPVQCPNRASSVEYMRFTLGKMSGYKE